MVQQLSVFLQNKSGKIAAITDALAHAEIDIRALSIADTEHYGILRCIVSDIEKGVKALKEAGYTARLTDVVAVCVPDRPGGLAEVLELLNDEGISVEYVYSFVRSSGSYALVIFHLSDLEKGTKVLTEHGVKLLQQEQIRSL